MRLLSLCFKFPLRRPFDVCFEPQQSIICLGFYKSFPAEGMLVLSLVEKIQKVFFAVQVAEMLPNDCNTFVAHLQQVLFFFSNGNSEALFCILMQSALNLQLIML